jgi:hypothetical protein
MEVKVTKHAIQRYRERSGRKATDTKEIVAALKATALQGKMVGYIIGDAFEIEYQGLHIIAVQKDNVLTILTCLGSSRYRNWSRRVEITPKHKLRKAN